MTYGCFFHHAGLQPLPDAVQVQVDADQAQLPSPLDQLVRLHHEPLGGKQTPHKPWTNMQQDGYSDATSLK